MEQFTTQEPSRQEIQVKDIDFSTELASGLSLFLILGIMGKLVVDSAFKDTEDEE